MIQYIKYLSIALCLSLVTTTAFSKPGADIKIVSPNEIVLASQSQEILTLRFTTSLPAAEVRFHVLNPTEGLILPLRQFERSITADSSLRIDIPIETRDQSREQIIIQAHVNENGQSSYRNFGLIVHVGEKQAPQVKQLKSTNSDTERKIKALPVREHSR